MAKLSKEQWQDLRLKWERDSREGHQWLADELMSKGFDVNRVTIAKAAKRQGWVKKSLGKSVTEKVTHSDKKVTEKVTEKVTRTVTKRESNSVLVIDEAVTDKEDRLHGNSLYKHEYEEQVYKLCLLGATDAELADFFRVTETTVNNWKNDYPAFFESLRRGKIMADANVTEKLYHRALGYSHYEEKVFSNNGEILRADTTKYYPPDTAAIKLWLLNRRPKDWKANVEAPIDINLNVFPDKAVLDAMYEKSLLEAEERDKILVGRRERLGIIINQTPDND